MHKNFTLTKSQTLNSESIRPKDATINFIKQFARVCTIRKMEQKELGMFILN